jgi:ABC-2 type transport system permease protein
MNSGLFDNTLTYAKFILRRERVVSALWIVLTALFLAGLAAAFETTFNAESRLALAATFDNPAMVAMIGPVYGMDNFHSGAMYSVVMLLYAVIVAAVMNVFLVSRHTRKDEEDGRHEVVRALPLGRLSILTSTLLTAALINTIMALAVGFGLFALGDASFTLGGSLLFGAAMGAVGWFFAAVTALSAQFSPNNRAVVGYAFMVVGAAFLTRSVGDIDFEVLSLLSPLGLPLRVQPYVGNFIWPLIALIIAANLTALAALKLNANRDLGQGLIAARPGRAHAQKYVKTPFGFTLKLNMGAVIVWFAVLFTLGASYGAVLGDIDGFIQSNEFYGMLMGYMPGLNAAVLFAAFQNATMTMVTLIPLLIILLRMKSEEKEHRAEAVLATALGHKTYMLTFIALAFICSVLFQLANIIGLYASAQAVMPNPAELPFGQLLEAGLVYLPALWAVMGLAIFIIGLLPKATYAIWGYFAFAFFMVLLGRMEVLPEFVNYLSPFHYIPQLPMEEIKIAPLAVLTAIAAALGTVGLWAYGRRDKNVN